MAKHNDNIARYERREARRWTRVADYWPLLVVAETADCRSLRSKTPLPHKLKAAAKATTAIGRTNPRRLATGGRSERRVTAKSEIGREPVQFTAGPPEFASGQ